MKQKLFNQKWLPVALGMLCMPLSVLAQPGAGQQPNLGQQRPRSQGQQQRPRFFYDGTNPDAHDPVMAVCDGKYYLFTTGIGCNVSDDMLNWRQGPRVMTETPQWSMEAVPGFRGGCWAPDISFHNGLWYMYYSCSSFGRNGSAIGLRTNKTLNPDSPDYKWEDQGMVVKSEQGKTNWNAIDPNLIIDDKGNPWLVWGSFWDGIQLVKLQKDFKTPVGESKTVARRYLPRNMANQLSEEDKARAAQAPAAGANAIEAPFIIKEGGYYYLFVSWDYCCKGVNSNYKVAVGRSKKVEGPYLDSKGVDMAAGGGDIVAQADNYFYGIGHTAHYKIDGQWYFLAHGYSKGDNGASKLVIKKMSFNADGWPVLGERVQADPLKGLRMNVIGDSYVANHLKDKSESWHAKVAKAHRMTYNNYGRNGGAIAWDRTDRNFGKAISERYTEMTNDADIVLIIAGHNDTEFVSKDETNLQIFRDSLDHLLTNLRVKYPQGHIGYVTPWYVDRPGFDQVVASIREICQAHNVPVLDNYSNRCVIRVRDDAFRRQYFQSANDTAHLNDAGHDLFLPVGESFLRTLVMQY